MSSKFDFCYDVIKQLLTRQLLKQAYLEILALLLMKC